MRAPTSDSERFSPPIPQMESQGPVSTLKEKEEGGVKVEGSSLIEQMESMGPITKDGVTWLLPEMQEDRSEPELEITYTRTITGNENDIGFFRGYVFFSWPDEPNTEIYCDSSRKYVFLSSSEQSAVTIAFKYYHGIEGRGKAFEKISNKGESIDYTYEAGVYQHIRPVMGDMQMQAMREPRAMRVSSLGSKPKLMVQKHGPNTDLNLLTAAYVSTGSHVSTPNRVFIVPGNGIYKQRTPLGNTVLHLAAACGNNAMVEKVAQQAPHLFTVTNSNYDTALHAAARAGRASTIQNLLNTWFHLVRRETDGHREDQPTLLMMLLVSLTLLRNKQGNTFLHEAFMVNAHAGALIFKAFEDPFMRDNSELEAEFKKIVNNLVVFAINGKGESLLYVAIEVGCKQVVDQLLDICIQYDLQPQGKSPLVPTLTNRNMVMLQTILSKKPNWIHLRNEEGSLPLHQAASMGYRQGVSFLLKRCSSCTLERDNDGFFPIHLACSGADVRVVEELLKYYPDPSEMLDKNGRTLLHAAAKSGKYKMVRHILQLPKLEFMINHKDNDGNTPLHLATLHGHATIVHSLTWDNRANLASLNHKNQTALDIAYLLSGKSKPLAQTLTRIALQSAGTPRSFVSSTLLSNDTVLSSEEEESRNTGRYKDRIDALIDTLILVSTLIITASFAAGFAMPGDVDQGTAIMLNHVMFHLFILSLTISIFGAIIATVLLIWARLDDPHLTHFALLWAFQILGISLTALSLAFLAGVYLVVSKLSWLTTTFLVLSVVLIFMVVFLYALFLLPSPSTVPFIRYISYYPFLVLAYIVSRGES